MKLEIVFCILITSLSAFTQTTNVIVFHRLLSVSNTVLMTNAEFRCVTGNRIFFRDEAGYEGFSADVLNSNVLTKLNLNASQLDSRQTKFTDKKILSAARTGDTGGDFFSSVQKQLAASNDPFGLSQDIVHTMDEYSMRRLVLAMEDNVSTDVIRNAEQMERMKELKVWLMAMPCLLARAIKDTRDSAKHAKEVDEIEKCKQAEAIYKMKLNQANKDLADFNTNPMASLTSKGWAQQTNLADTNVLVAAQKGDMSDDFFDSVQKQLAASSDPHDLSDVIVTTMIIHSLQRAILAGSEGVSDSVIRNMVRQDDESQLRVMQVEQTLLQAQSEQANEAATVAQKNLVVSQANLANFNADPIGYQRNETLVLASNTLADFNADPAGYRKIWGSIEASNNLTQASNILATFHADPIRYFKEWNLAEASNIMADIKADPVGYFTNFSQPVGSNILAFASNTLAAFHADPIGYFEKGNPTNSTR